MCVDVLYLCLTTKHGYVGFETTNISYVLSDSIGILFHHQPPEAKSELAADRVLWVRDCSDKSILFSHIPFRA